MINWRASLVPAAAVIPAPIGYIKVVAVKKLVVVFLVDWCLLPIGANWFVVGRLPFCGFKWSCGGLLYHMVAPLRHWEQIGVLKAGFTALNILAWNDKVWLIVHFVGYEWKVMINRNSCGGTRTGKSEVKFLDFPTTNDCESIYQGCFHWSRTKVRGSKMIRYHRSSHSKRCRLGIEFSSLSRRISAPYVKTKSLGSGGSMVARLKLKGIDGRAHQRWSLRFNSTQHGETHQVQTWEGLTVWKHFLDFMGGGAWPFLVGGVICLVDSDNERDSQSKLVRS